MRDLSIGYMSIGYMSIGYMSLYSLRLPRQLNRSTYELYGSRGNINDLLETTPFQRESGIC